MNLPTWARLAVAIGVAASFAYLATPVAILAARRLAFYDVPFGHKGHKTPTPYLGGAAVVAAFAVALLLDGGHVVRTLPLLGGVFVLLVIGTVDDRRTVSPLTRVAVEFVLGVLLNAAGLGWHLGIGELVDIVVNGLWVVAVVNAFNLFDNMDGAASTMALVVMAGTCVLALITHQYWVSFGSASLCGACVGFLPHNLARPARIFLGDGGSMPLGFAVAVLVATAAKGAEPSLLAMLVGSLLVGVPALDTALVIISRHRRGVSFLTGGQDHLTHRTQRRVRTARRVALVLGSVQATVSALVIVATRESSATLVYILLAFVVCAAAAVVALEQTEGETTGTAESRRITPASGGSATPPRWRTRIGMGAALIVGLVAGLGAFFSGYYDTGVWVPIGLVATVAAAAAAVARPPRVTLPMLLSLAGVAGLGLWSLLSTSWSIGREAAIVDANRWLAYAALFVLMLVLVSSRSRAKALLLATALGIGLVAISVVVRMLGSDPGSLFLSGRLNSPLGYINGEGCLFSMAAWGAVALAERREVLVAGLGAAGAVGLAALALLSQSRGAAIASLVGLIVVLAVVPGRRRRIIALGVIVGGFIAAAKPVLNVYSSAHGGAVLPSSAHHAALAIILASLAAGAVWAALLAASRRFEHDRARAVMLRRVAGGLAVMLVLLPVVVAAVELPTIRQTVQNQWHAFVHVSDLGAAPSTSQTRLLSGAGNRYDYWRIAWHVFQSHPLAGLGSGNYSTAYFEQRATQESIQNPHSIELQALSELGLVGMALLVTLIVGAAVGVARLRRAAAHSPVARTMMVAAVGMFVVWLVDTSADWMHLLPGLTAIALAAVAVLCREWRTDRAVARYGATSGRARIPVLAGAAAIAFVLAVTGAGLARAALVTYYLHSARGELSGHPAAAIRDATRALRLDGANLDAYYIKAAGQARFDRARAAYSTLRQAAREDRDSFVTWTLLGDLEVRLRNFSAARAFYGRAHALDPRDPGLAILSRNPAAALSNQGG